MNAKDSVIMQNKVFALIGLATVAILCVPFVAMQFSDQVSWSTSDYVSMGSLVFVIASMFVFVARKFTLPKQRIVAALFFGALLLWLWAELAVGVFTNWGS